MIETWVYVIHETFTGYHKIGKSLNPFKRLEELKAEKTLLPVAFDFKLIEAWRGTFADETRLHSHFKAKRKRGEWFDLDENDLDYIARTYFYKYTRLFSRDSLYELENSELIENANSVDFMQEAIGV